MKTFEQYHKENPAIWEQFKKVTFEAIKKGFKTYGSKGIFEIIRWHQGGEIKKDGFKINNNYAPNYARKFMVEFPENKDIFRIRTLKK